MGHVSFRHLIGRFSTKKRYWYEKYLRNTREIKITPVILLMNSIGLLPAFRFHLKNSCKVRGDEKMKKEIKIYGHE